MNISDIKYADMINGEGIRVSIFVSGCSHRCKGCFNKETWNHNYGKLFTKEIKTQIFSYISQYNDIIKGISFLGGDPTYHKNIDTLVEFITEFKNLFPKKNIWIWSGYTWEEIIKNNRLFSLISLCDILVDGKFKIEEKDLSLKWRGSRNQRVIDIKQSIKYEKAIETDL